MSTLAIPTTKLYNGKIGSTSSMSIDLSKKRSITNIEPLRTVLIAIPDSVEFRNYESNKLYQKVVSLQNVSTTLARFQLVARRSDSRFAVTIEPKGQRGGIAPGMRVKLVVRFRGDVLDEPEETLTVNVQQGRSVIVKLCGYRDPPILRAVNISHFRYPQKESHAVPRDTESVAEIPFEQTYSGNESTGSSSYGTSSDTPSTRTESIPHCGQLKSFDCGTCPVGGQIALSLMVKNIGGEGRFFLMSELDWCCMHIEDVTDNNMLVLASFAVRPAYFTLKPQEYTHLYLYFFPDAHGTHVNYNMRRNRKM